MKYNRLIDIQQDLEAGKTSCSALIEDYLRRINENKHLNAFLEVFEDEAKQRAAQLDQKQGPKGKLYGLVIAIKDNICYKDHKVSASSKILEGFTSLYSSTAVERLLAEDAIIIGRTNCDEFAMGSSNENSAYGPVLNAQDNSRVPGGSSGGSVVAVQADLAHAALGSETGGSVRQPAAFTGTVGLKTTYGRISRHGLIAFGSSFDQIGPVTHSVEDAALLLEVIAGKDEFDATSSSKEVPAYSKQLNWEGKARIAYFEDVINHQGNDSEVREHTLQLIEQLKADGHTVEPVDFPYTDYIIPTYYVLSTAEASSNLARYDGVHYGYRSPNASNMDEVYVKSRSEGFGKEVQRRIMLGTFVLSAGYYDAYYGKGQKVRRLLSESLDKIFADYDFIISPTSPNVAFKMGERTSDPVSMYLADIYTALANLTGVPGISLPLYANEEGLPIGMQLMAPKFAEDKLLAFSQHMMRYAKTGQGVL